MEKTELLNQLKARYKNCTSCPLATQGRTQVVFGQGNPDAKLMLVGEGPGKDEDIQGAPFVGRSGKLLMSLLQATGLTREQIYISNVVKCRPPNNRPPTPYESKTCTNILLWQEIEIIKPMVICTLGNTATQALLGPHQKINGIRGTLQAHNGYLIMPTYHPAYLLRNPTKKNIVLDDLRKILATIQKSNAK